MTDNYFKVRTHQGDRIFPFDGSSGVSIAKAWGSSRELSRQVGSSVSVWKPIEQQGPWLLAHVVGRPVDDGDLEARGGTAGHPFLDDDVSLDFLREDLMSTLRNKHDGNCHPQQARWDHL